MDDDYLMSPKSRFDRTLLFEKLAIAHARRTTNAAISRARLDQIARRDPRTVLGVLEYWLSPQRAGSKPRVDFQD